MLLKVVGEIGEEFTPNKVTSLRSPFVVTVTLCAGTDNVFQSTHLLYKNPTAAPHQKDGCSCVFFYQIHDFLKYLGSRVFVEKHNVNYNTKKHTT